MLNGIAVVPGAEIVTTVGQGGVGATSGPDVAAGNGFDSSLLIGETEIVGNGGNGFYGGNATNGFKGGDAGKTGYSNYFSGQKIVYGAGGGEATDTTAATAATSSGNGGSTVAGNTAGGAGGSGVVVIRYATDPLNAFPASFGTPFARYVAGDYQSEDSALKSWVDSSGSGRHAVDVTGAPKIEVGTSNGATGNIVAVAGGVEDAVTFPSDVLPQKYTLFHVSRYAGENQGRIVAGSTGDWYSGFVDDKDGGKVGVAKHNSVMKDGGGESHRNWLLSSDQNAVYRANGVQVSTKTNGMSFSGPLTVNGSNGGPKRASDWQVAEVLVYEGELTLAQIQQMENYFARTYGLKGKNAAGVDVGILSTKAIKAKQKDEKSIDLTWTPPTDTTNLDDYVVEFSTDKKTWKLYDHTPTTNNKITVLGLDDVSEYDFRVTPSYADVTNEQTDAGAEAVAIKTIARAPTDVSGVPGDSKVTVSWTAPTATGNTAITRYEVKYSTSVDGEYITFPDNTIAKSPAVVTGLKNGTPYFFKVAAVNTAGPGDDSAPSDAVTPRTVPGVPTNVKSTPDATGGVDVSWGAPTFDGGSAITAYVVKSCLGTQCSTQETDGVTKTLSLIDLEIGKAYTFQVAATNAAGTGPYSDSTTATTPRVKPGAPVDVVGEAGNAEVALTWSAPEVSGGSGITSYTVEICKPGKPDAICIVKSGGNSGEIGKTFTGLTNGAPYTFRVAATNEAGTGVYSLPSEPVTPRTVPDAPTTLVVAPDNSGNFDVSWVAPKVNGGAVLTDYVIEYQKDGGEWTKFVHEASTQTSATLENLNVGAEYLVRVAAVNIAGAGEFTTTTTVVIPRTPPAAPTKVAGVPGNQLVDLTWTAPKNNGSEVSDYVVRYCVAEACTIFEDGESAKALAQVKELTNGTEYTFAVAAVNAAGVGAYSLPSEGITPRTVPGAPTAVKAAIDDEGNVIVTWTAPTDNGGADITDYVVQSCTGTTCVVFDDGDGNTVSAAVTGLKTGVAHTFKVAAKNIAGVGAYSVASDVAVPRKIPGIAQNVKATADNLGNIDLVWDLPESDGGSPLTDFVVQACKDTLCEVVADGVSPLAVAKIKGLEIGVSYTFKVAAKNVAGTGGYSDESNAATPRVVPGAPTNVEAAANDEGVIALTWSAPEFTGGAPLTGYVVQACTGQNCVEVAQINSATTTSASINDLVTGTLYTFKVAAKNIAGIGAYSDTSNAIAPRSLPGAPRSVVADANNTGGIRVTWVAPLSNGGIDITGYEIQACIEGKCSDAATSNGEELAVVVEKLTLGKAYAFTVAAKNTIGLGEYSSPSNEVTPRTPPPAPTAVTAVVNNVGGVDVSWTAPEQNNGAAITGYTISACEDAGPVVEPSETNPTPITIIETCSDVGVTSASVTNLAVGNLRAGQAYTFTVAAINIAGIGTYSDPSGAVTPRVVPDAPTNVVAEVGNRGLVSVTWDAPVFNGGVQITDYVVNVCTSAGCVVYSDIESELAVASVANLNVGTSYTFIVAAVNAAGTGAYSDPSAAVTPRTLPQPPTGVKATPNNSGGIVATWIAPANNGGASITRYDVRACLSVVQLCVNPVAVQNGSGDLQVVLDEDFTLGSTYYVEVSAVNVAGSSEYSDPSNDVVVRKTPDAPTAVKAAPNNVGGIQLSWTVPPFSGAAITDYLVQACVSGKCGPVEDGLSSSNSATISGLTVGTNYTFIIAAQNVAGIGAYSDPSNSSIPRLLPGAPTQVSAVADKLGNLDVTWATPSGNGAAITDYIIQSCAATVCTTFEDGTSDAPSVRVTKLPLGVAVAFIVKAVNAAGPGGYSSPSTEAVPVSPPGAPTKVDGTPGNTFVDLTWTAPDVTGGVAISGYVVQVCASGSCVTTNATSNSATIAGLKNGTPYTFTVAAVNSIGTGVASDASRDITPRTIPGAPTKLVATADFERNKFVEWKNPADNGGASITSYRMEWCIDGFACANINIYQGMTGPAYAPDLQENAYTFGENAPKVQILNSNNQDTSFKYRVSVKNEAGWGPWSQLSNAVIARSRPNVPSNVEATANNVGGIELKWIAPSANNEAITDYVVKACADKKCGVVEDGKDVFATKIITGLELGKEYTFTVAAVNLAGTSDDSSPSNGATPRTVPAAPTNVVPTIDNEGQVALTWDAPEKKGGNEISDYAVQSCIGDKCTLVKDEVSKERKATVTGLTNGIAYTFKVAATNAAGTGAYSKASSSVTPRTVPGVPKWVKLTSGNTEVILEWSAPLNDGGNAITDYAVQSCIGDKCTPVDDGVSKEPKATVIGLNNGIAYTFKVAAINAAKSGAYSEKSALVTPRTVPGAPTVKSAEPDNTGGVDVSWTPPTDDGGNAISDYTVQSCEGAKPCATFTRPATTNTTVAASCAAGGTCRVGDTGPGGGKVFYVAPTSFVSAGSACDTRCKYLEAAPIGWIKAATPAGQFN
ncbi:MAG: fibronectin type III domain-containing protein, partial [bacterium]